MLYVCKSNRNGIMVGEGMNKLNVRVDDRLIHGQTIVAWCPKFKIDEIIAIDNVSAKNPVLKSIMTMGVPNGYKAHIVTAQEALDLLKTPSEKNRLVIVKYPSVLKDIQEVLNKETEIVLGNIAKREDTIHKISGATGIFYLSDQDIEDIQNLVDKGVKVTFQQLPNTQEITWENFIERK